MKSQNYSQTYFNDIKQYENENSSEFNKVRKTTISLDLCEKSMYNDKYLPRFLLDEVNSEIYSKHTTDYEIHEARENDDAFDFTAIEKSIEDFKTENSISNPFSSDNEFSDQVNNSSSKENCGNIMKKNRVNFHKEITSNSEGFSQLNLTSSAGNISAELKTRSGRENPFKNLSSNTNEFLNRYSTLSGNLGYDRNIQNINLNSNGSTYNQVNRVYNSNNDYHPNTMKPPVRSNSNSYFDMNGNNLGFNMPINKLSGVSGPLGYVNYNNYGLSYNIGQMQNNICNVNNQINYSNPQNNYGNNFNTNFSGNMNHNYSGFNNMNTNAMCMQQGQYDPARNFKNSPQNGNFENKEMHNLMQSKHDAGYGHKKLIQNYKSHKQIPQKSNSSGNIIDIMNKNLPTAGNLSSFVGNMQHSNSSKTLDTIILNSRKQKASLFNNNNSEADDNTKLLNNLLSGFETDLHVFITTQKGSRTMQKILDKITPQSLDIILERLKNYFAYIMTDTYGNYFCQRLIQCCSSYQRIFILTNMKQDIIHISMNSCGTHSLQSLIEIINIEEEGSIIIDSIKGSVMKLSLDVNSTHVIQKLILCLDEANRADINSEVLTFFPKLIVDSNGVCVLKKFINKNKSEEIRKIFIGKITKNILEIVQNPFGNYVIQFALDEWRYEYTKDIITPIIKNVVSLSMQKFSSNVVEKCLQLCESVRNDIMKELFSTSKTASLVKNKYGNFVLQKAISLLDEEKRKEIKEDIVSKIKIASNKEKSRLNKLIEML